MVTPCLWKTKKQDPVFRLSAEAEYKSIAVVTSELVLLHIFLASLGFFLKQPIYEIVL